MVSKGVMTCLGLNFVLGGVDGAAAQENRRLEWKRLEVGVLRRWKSFISNHFQKQEPKLVSDLHLAYFETSWLTEKLKFHPRVKKVRPTSGKIGNPFTAVTS